MSDPGSPVPAGVLLRPMRWWDVQPALIIENAVFSDAWPEATFWSELAGVPQTRYYLVAERGGRVVGYAGLFAIRHQADVQTLAVAADAQGHGLGRLLLEALLTEGRRRGCGEVLLEVRADNVPAQRLYEQVGFERISIRRGYYPPVHSHPVGSTGVNTPSSADALVLRLRL